MAPDQGKLLQKLFLAVEGIAAMFSTGWHNLILILLILPSQVFGLRIPVAVNGHLTQFNDFTKLIRRKFPP